MFCSQLECCDSLAFLGDKPMGGPDSTCVPNGNLFTISFSTFDQSPMGRGQKEGSTYLIGCHLGHPSNRGWQVCDNKHEFIPIPRRDVFMFMSTGTTKTKQRERQRQSRRVTNSWLHSTKKSIHFHCAYNFGLAGFTHNGLSLKTRISACESRVVQLWSIRWENTINYRHFNYLNQIGLRDLLYCGIT